MHTRRTTLRGIGFRSPGRCAGSTAGTVLVLVLALAAAGCGGRPKAPGVPTGATVGRQVDAASRRAPRDGVNTRGVVDRYMARQVEKFSAVEGTTVERTGDEIHVTLESEPLFALDSAQLNLEARDRIRRLAQAALEYTDTEITITGHTDSEGPEDFNQRLSERRAQSIRNCFVDMGVAPGRIRAIGFGELQPVAGNDTEAGRRRNRRIEIRIHPSEAFLKRAAADRGSR